MNYTHYLYHLPIINKIHGIWPFLIIHRDEIHRSTDDLRIYLWQMHIFCPYCRRRQTDKFLSLCTYTYFIFLCLWQHLWISSVKFPVLIIYFLLICGCQKKCYRWISFVAFLCCQKWNSSDKNNYNKDRGKMAHPQICYR